VPKKKKPRQKVAIEKSKFRILKAFAVMFQTLCIFMGVLGLASALFELAYLTRQFYGDLILATGAVFVLGYFHIYFVKIKKHIGKWFAYFAVIFFYFFILLILMKRWPDLKSVL